MTFEFTGRAGTGFLKVREGCYVSVGDVSTVGVGVEMTDEHGVTVFDDKIVALCVRSGQILVFEPCETAEAATAMAGELVVALTQNILTF